ncbi:DUF4430 domain-containing protein [Sporosarcina sp. OR05]|uniref:DUF4430 domain-containing protein n=1 Tax=Sporosarcina sp. OR05 TaxID=2969819 RepID=UPI00352B9FF8
MKLWKSFASLLIMVTLAILVTACGTSLQKPTGLEDTDRGSETVELAQQEDGEQQTANTENERQDIASGTTESVEENATEMKDTEPSKQPEKAAQKDGKSDSTTAHKTEKPAQQSTEKPATQPAEKPAEKPSDKPAAKPAEKPVTNPSDKPTSKPTEKPTTKPSDKPATKPTPPAQPTSSKVVYSIVISSTEVPLAPTEMDIQDGDSVLSALIAITKSKKIQMDYRGGQGATAYVEGIDNVYEFDRGQGSGWMYRVNGIFPDRGAGVVPLQDGDRVEWLYTTNLGVDLNANLQPFRR